MNKDLHNIEDRKLRERNHKKFTTILGESQTGGSIHSTTSRRLVNLSSIDKHDYQVIAKRICAEPMYY